jgi:hypothetical protein
MCRFFYLVPNIAFWLMALSCFVDEQWKKKPRSHEDTVSWQMGKRRIETRK